MTKMTITRALAELTLLAKRIHDKTESTVFISNKFPGFAFRDHSEETKSNYQSIVDMTEQYTRIKFAILNSNAVTKVNINNTVYSVVEAIAMKSCIKYKMDLLYKLKETLSKTETESVAYDTNLRSKLDNLLSLNFSKDRKTDENDIKSISETYLKNNKIEVVDPLNIKHVIAKLEQETSNFSKEIDFTLAESNAITVIEV